MSVYFKNNFARAFGTFPLNGDELRAALECALTTGYRAFDTAQLYDNEQIVGDTLARSGINPENLNVTTKVMHRYFDKALFMDSVKVSRDKLQLEQIDVLLLHWPPADGDVRPSLELLREAQIAGLTEHIGVSNYTAAMMAVASETLDVPLVTNQVEFHPLLNQQTLLNASRQSGIPLSSYCSVARGRVFQEPVLQSIAENMNKSVAQITLRWILQQGVSVNTMSTKPENIRANYAVDDFALSQSDMNAITALTATQLRIVDSRKVPWAPAWDTPENMTWH